MRSTSARNPPTIRKTRLRGSEMQRVVLALALFALVSLSLMACTDGPSAIDTIDEVASIERGKPLLVFVYVDGWAP